MTLYKSWKQWTDKGTFSEMMAGLATDHGEDKTVIIDANHLKAHWTVSSMRVEKGGVDV